MPQPIEAFAPAAPEAVRRTAAGAVDFDHYRAIAERLRGEALAGFARRFVSLVALPATQRHRRARPVRLHRAEEIF